VWITLPSTKWPISPAGTPARAMAACDQRGQFAGLLVFQRSAKLPMAARAADTR
jgi:hypothetical protein